MKNAVYIFLLLAFAAHADEVDYASERAAMVVEVEYYSMLARDADDFVERYKFHISPATDNQPYFFHFFTWSALPEIIALLRRGGGV